MKLVVIKTKNYIFNGTRLKSPLYLDTIFKWKKIQSQMSHCIVIDFHFISSSSVSNIHLSSLII